jgi:hypothetical protein
MRLACAHCSGLQPPDWQSGDACIHCGRIARPESLCFWCVEWIPTGSFCRSCGAAVVPRTHYGAARMLKDAGVDRFRLPEMLAAMDVEQRENLDRIYQRQAAIVARHIDDVAFLEQYLFQKTFAADVELELLRRLPLAPDAFDAFAGTPPPAAESPLGRAQRIAQSAPSALSRTLAEIVRLRLDDWKAFPEVPGLARHPSPHVRTEAALAVTGWRVIYGLPDGFDRRTLPQEIWDELRQSPFPLAATVRLALWDEAIAVTPDALYSADPDISLTAALARGETSVLAAALTGDSLMQLAAGTKLVRLHCFSPLRQLLAPSDRAAPTADTVLYEILTLASQRRYRAPELRNELFALIETHAHPRVRQRAASVLTNACQPNDGLRLIRAANGDSGIQQSILQSPCLDRDSLEAVCAYLIEHGRFHMQQFGLSTVAEKGPVSDSFVPRHFAQAPDEDTRIELCKFAELQLIERGDEDLHRFLIHIVYGQHPAQLRGDAWWCLRRWYLRSDPRGESPVALAIAPAKRFFDTPQAFVLKFAALLTDTDTVTHLGLSDDLQRILREAQLDVLTAAGDRTAWRLADAVTTLMRNTDAAFTLRIAGASFFSVMAQHPDWRKQAHGVLQSFLRTDLDHAVTQALGR